jgi:hypothetical protein
MSAAFDSEQPDNSDPPLSQETVSADETIQQKVSIIGTLPLFCRTCTDIRYTKDLTTCPTCQSSSVVKCAVVHYAETCEEGEHDPRFKPGRSSTFKTGYFRIPCQTSPFSSVKPKNLSPTLDAVTCPRCLDAIGAEINEYGRLLDLQEY